MSTVDSYLVEGFRAYRDQVFRIQGLTDYYITYYDAPLSYATAYTLHKILLRSLEPSRPSKNAFGIYVDLINRRSLKDLGKYPIVRIIPSRLVPIEFPMLLAKAFKKAGLLVRVWVDDPERSASLEVAVTPDVLLSDHRYRFFEVMRKMLLDKPKISTHECSLCGAETHNESGICSKCMMLAMKSDLRRYAETLDPSDISGFKRWRASLKHLFPITPIRELNVRWISDNGLVCAVCGRHDIALSSCLDSPMVCFRCAIKVDLLLLETLLENGVWSYDDLPSKIEEVKY